MNRFWPVELHEGQVGLRPLASSDARAWTAIRRRNADWLRRWEATVPAGDPAGPRTYRGLVRDLRRQAREGRSMPFAVTVEDRFVGQLTVSNIVGGSAKWAQIGYWVDQRHAGRGVIPTAVALVVDYCFAVVGLHRIEVAIRPENTASLRVVEKLGFTEYGYAPRYLHIDGDWRDHRLFAMTAEECPEGLLRWWRRVREPGPAG